MPALKMVLNKVWEFCINSVFTVIFCTDNNKNHLKKDICIIKPVNKMIEN